MLERLSRQPRLRVLGLLAPSLVWLVVFFLVPLLIVVAMSFGERGTYGGVEWSLSFDNFIRLTDPLYLRIFGRSLVIAAITTLLTLLIGYPLAFWIASQRPKRRNSLLLLLMIPFWTNFLVRTYAWILLLRDQGLINSLWTGPVHRLVESLASAIPALPLDGIMNATAEPIPLFGTSVAIIIGLTYGWLPEMVLPCYAASERFDFSLAEAAQDLYANHFKTFVKVVLPLTMPGIIAGSVLVFIPSLGAYVTPDLLGGARTVMIGNVIYSQFLSARDYPFGAATAVGLMVLMLLGTLLYIRQGMAEGERQALLD